MGRNTALLREIVAVLDTRLDDIDYALDQLKKPLPQPFTGGCGQRHHRRRVC